MKKILVIFTFVMTSLLYAAQDSYYVIKIKCCSWDKCYVVTNTTFDSLKKSIHFKSKKEAKNFIKKLSPTLKNKNPKIKFIEE